METQNQIEQIIYEAVREFQPPMPRYEDLTFKEDRQVIIDAAVKILTVVKGDPDAHS